jgi:hypothetical protein
METSDSKDNFCFASTGVEDAGDCFVTRRVDIVDGVIRGIGIQVEVILCF